MSTRAHLKTILGVLTNSNPFEISYVHSWHSIFASSFNDKFGMWGNSFWVFTHTNGHFTHMNDRGPWEKNDLKLLMIMVGDPKTMTVKKSTSLFENLGHGKFMFFTSNGACPMREGPMGKSFRLCFSMGEHSQGPSKNNGLGFPRFPVLCINEGGQSLDLGGAHLDKRNLLEALPWRGKYQN